MKQSLIAIALSLILSLPAFGQTYSDKFYYEIGGGQLSDSALSEWNAFTLDLDPYASSQYSCGDFDLDESLKALIRDIADVPDDFEEYLKVAGIDLLYGLIALSIQKAAPGVYEYLTNSFIRHKEFLQLKLANCRRAEALLSSGDITKLADFAKLIEWRKAIEEGKSVQDAEAEVDGKEGIPWVDGEYYGGEDQDPIKLVEHSTVKGYENLLGGTSTGATTDSSIAYYFPAATDAKDWAVEVFGDKIISFVGDNQSITGSGLQAAISATTEEVAEILEKVVPRPSTASKDELDQLSTPNYRVTVSALSAIGARKLGQQEVLKSRLASEIATLQAIEKAYIVRDLIVSATDDPHIYYSPLKDDHYKGLIAQIDDGIEVARNKAKVRNEFMGQLLITTFETRDELEDQPSNLPGAVDAKETLRGTGVLPEE